MVLTSFSKLYGLSGLRVGFASGNADFLKGLEKDGMTFPFNSLAIYFLRQALAKEGPLKKIGERIQIHKKEIEDLLAAKPKIEIRQSVTNCIFCRAKNKKNLYKKLLALGVASLDLDRQRGVEEKGWVRITVHSSRKLHQYLINALQQL